MLPTVHGFDEWLGNLYHLNAEEEPENVDYPKDPAFKAKFGPRGVLHCFATDKDDPTDDPRFGKVGKQKCEDTGPLTSQAHGDGGRGGHRRGDQVHGQGGEGRQAVLRLVELLPHARLHAPQEGKSRARPVWASMPTAWSSTTAMVGQLLAKLKELGIEDNTIVMYSTDNGAEFFNWPDGGSTMFRGEKNTQWEGGFRVPTVIRWPGVIKPGTVINDIGAHEDMIPTLLAAAGDTTVKEDLLKGRKIGDMTYKVHLDGYNLLPFFKGDVKESPRHEFIYWTDGGSVAALRYNNWKITFLRQNSVGIKVWETPFEELRWPMLTNLRMDPFERASDESIGHPQWAAERMFVLAPAGAYVGQWLQSFREFPPRQKPGSFSLDRVMEAVTAPQKGSN